MRTRSKAIAPCPFSSPSTYNATKIITNLHQNHQKPKNQNQSHQLKLLHIECLPTRPGNQSLSHASSESKSLSSTRRDREIDIDQSSHQRAAMNPRRGLSFLFTLFPFFFSRVFYLSCFFTETFQSTGPSQLFERARSHVSLSPARILF